MTVSPNSPISPNQFRVMVNPQPPPSNVLKFPTNVQRPLPPAAGSSSGVASQKASTNSPRVNTNPPPTPRTPQSSSFNSGKFREAFRQSIGVPQPTPPFSPKSNPFTNPKEFSKEWSDYLEKYIAPDPYAGRIPKPTGSGVDPNYVPINRTGSGTYSRKIDAIEGVKYKVTSYYKQRSITETVWVNNQAKFRHLRWEIEGVHQAFLYPPFVLEWRPADPSVKENYINPPSEYQWLRLYHRDGVYELAGNSNSYWAIGEWYLTPDTPPDSPTIPGYQPGEGSVPGSPPTAGNPQLPPTILQPGKGDSGDPTTETPGRGREFPYPPNVIPFPGRGRPPGLIPESPNVVPFRRPPRLPEKPDRTNPEAPGLPPKFPPELPTPPNIEKPTLREMPKVPKPGKDRCIPQGSNEKLSCRYQKDSDVKLDELLKRVGKPNDVDGLAGIVGKDKPKHPVTKLPTDLVSMSKLNFLTSTISAIFAPFNFLASIHNAFMLSADIKETLGSFLSTTLDVARTALSLKDPDDAMIDINEIVNTNFEAFMDKLLGASNWETIKQRAAAVNRIYMAQTNAMYAVKNAFDNVFESIGTIGNYTGSIGNALKRAQVVYDDAYDWMDTSMPAERGRLGRFMNLTGRLEGVEDAANMLLAVASSVKEVQEGAKDVADAMAEYERAKAAATEAFREGSSQGKQQQKAELAADTIKEVELKTFDFEDN